MRAPTFEGVPSKVVSHSERQISRHCAPEAEVRWLRDAGGSGSVTLESRKGPQFRCVAARGRCTCECLNGAGPERDGHSGWRQGSPGWPHSK
ncbi:PREDICTED: RNMT-activating mini protein isoform X2 [Chinchilla lanigera]|uniref:RNMT-activating mini protein isoform X2 n=1 Tax=Chinchilla lanigera TaxID=34839 RepID=UPI0006971AA5|nr:PREDICTED: RNMT-activating mini protein isoform X2 [Chinchilla lanigera]